MEMPTWVLLVSALVALAGVVLRHVRPERHSVAAFLASTGIGGVGWSAVLGRFNIATVILAGMSFLAAVSIIIEDALLTRAETIALKEEEKDGK